MKFLKYAFIILLLAVISDTALVLAYATPSGVSIYKELVKNNSQWTDYKTKNTTTKQKYENIRTFTWLNDPCANCRIAAKPVDEAGDVYSAVVSTEGQTKTFDDLSHVNWPNNFRLNIWRLDISVLTTTHSAVWMINPVN